MSQTSERVAIIGLDCVPPELVFERWADELPTFTRLRSEGMFGKLRSITPPITVPAWMCMMTGKSPGALGIYGFRNRIDHSYDGFRVVTSSSFREPALWDLLGQVGKSSIVVGVPPSYPPKPLRGCMVSCLLTPDTSVVYTQPPELKNEIEGAVGSYLFDVEDFRTDDRNGLLKRLYQLTEQRFALMTHLVSSKSWDFLAFVEMGPDRLHHGLWDCFDSGHRNYEPGNCWEASGLEYYRFLDQKLADFLGLFDDQTHIFIVSDHGAKRMDGGICVNEWLREEGYLTLLEPPATAVRLSPEMVKWPETMAWGEGGYYGRVFLNVRGREPHGVVEPGDYELLRTELKEKLEGLGDEEGNPIGTKVYRPEELYPEVHGIAPDLIVLFGDLYWRSVGSVGSGDVWTHTNDTGPDAANHAEDGIFLYAGPAVKCHGEERFGLRLLDIAPTVLRLFGLPVPSEMEGVPIWV